MRSPARFYILASGTVLALAGALVVVACESSTGPDAPARKNGCLNLDCPNVPVTGQSDGGTITGNQDGATSSSGGNGVNPIDGTTKTATLIKGKFQFTEGPVWIAGKLLFTDVNANQVVELLPDGGTSSFRANSNGANGLAINPKSGGSLIACEGGGKRVTKSGPNKGAQTTAIAETYDNQPLNAPNDVVVRADGNIYFTDPNYSGDPNTQDAEAVYRIDPEGGLSRVDAQWNKPNGIGLSPDGATLYVVDNGAGKLMRATLDAAGVPGAFAELASVAGGDGMAVDDAGNLYVADDAGIDVFDRNGGKIGTITVAVKPTNCTFGGADRQTLFITANGNAGANQTGLYSIKLNVPGLP